MEYKFDFTKSYEITHKMTDDEQKYWKAYLETDQGRSCEVVLKFVTINDSTRPSWWQRLRKVMSRILSWEIFRKLFQIVNMQKGKRS